MLVVGCQIPAGLEEAAVEVQVEVMGLDAFETEQGWHRAGELAEGVEDAVALEGSSACVLSPHDAAAQPA
jgi:hypothetical protein